MKCLLVIAHPLDDSLCKSLAEHTLTVLQQSGYEVQIEDLYLQEFSPLLTQAERRSYYTGRYASDQVSAEAGRLLEAHTIVLVFPTWWFGFPAILKGWFDRVWGPGIAYDHARNFGPIEPRLTNLRQMLAITSLGSPWWVDRFLLRRPVKRVLETAVLGACAPHCRFRMLSLYNSEHLKLTQVEAFKQRISRQLEKLSRATEK